VKVLHVIRSNDDPLARRIIDDIRRDNGTEQTLVLVQDGVYMKPEGLRVFACSDDVRARGVETDVPLVEYDQIIDMVFGHDRVITW